MISAICPVAACSATDGPLLDVTSRSTTSSPSWSGTAFTAWTTAATGLVSTGAAPDPELPDGVATTSTWSPGARPLAGSPDGLTATGTSCWPGPGESLLVSSDGASSVPGRSDVAATRPTTCDSCRAGTTWSPGPAATVVVPTSPEVITAPTGTAVVTMTTGTWWSSRWYS